MNRKKFHLLTLSKIYSTKCDDIYKARPNPNRFSHLPHSHNTNLISYGPYDMIHMIWTTWFRPYFIDYINYILWYHIEYKVKERDFIGPKIIQMKPVNTIFGLLYFFDKINFHLYLPINMFLLPKILLLSWCSRCFLPLIGPLS